MTSRARICEADFDANARQLLRLRICEGSPDPTVSYAPDSPYDADKRCTVTGPLTVQIAEIKRFLAGHTLRGAA